MKYNTSIAKKRGFTLVEVLIVIGVIAIVTIVAVYTLNPSQLIKQSRDSNRVSDASTLSIALGLSESSQLSLGNASTVYVSVPDPSLSAGSTSNCSSLGFATSSLPTGWKYQCASTASYRNINGTGWIPIDFTKLSKSSLFSALPVDPVNSTTTGNYYTYTTDGSVKYEVSANLEATNNSTKMSSDGGSYGNLYEVGDTTALLPIDYGTGYLYIADGNNCRIEKFTTTGDYVSRFGSCGSGNGQFSPNHFFGVKIDTFGNLYVLDDGTNSRVQKFDSNGNYLLQFGGQGWLPGYFYPPNGFALDASNNVYVFDSSNYRVEKFDSNGNYISLFGSYGTSTGQFSSSNGAGLAIDPSGNIYVGDDGKARIEKFDKNGNYLLQFGSSGTTTGKFGPGGGISSFYYVATDAKGNVYVSDQPNNRIEEFDSNGTYLKQIGSGGNGVGQFFSSAPGGISFDPSGNIYVAAGSSGNVQEFDSNGSSTLQFNIWPTQTGGWVRGVTYSPR